MKTIISICFILFSAVSIAQTSSTVTIEGTVLDKATQSPIEFATIVVYEENTNKMVGGITTIEDGSFSIDIRSEEVYIIVSFIGFEDQRIESLEFENGKATLGNIMLGTDSEVLDEAVITAEKSTTEFRLDKRVFNVGTDLSSTGASALEVLNNVPSVNVNIEGNVTLRGASGVQILINGKPSILADEAGNALGTITADMIEKVEVITNPSAKYDAEGTAGIINIVIKKDEKRGLNGSLSVNTGIPHNHSIGLSLNRRTEKFNLFTQMGVGYRSLPTTTENYTRNNIDPAEIISSGKEYRNENFYNIILGTDYYINPLNVITLSGSFAYEIEDQPSKTNFQYFENGIGTQAWERTEITEANNPKLQYELQYKKDFKDNKEHQLLFSAIGNYFGKDQSSLFMNDYSFGTPTQGNQTTATSFEEGKFTFKLDYTKPFVKNWTLETGAQYLVNDVSNDFTVSNEVNGEYVVDENQTNVFLYDQKVLGLYTTTAYESDSWGAKIGIRAENTDLNTFLVNTDKDNSQNFWSFFPTLHTSYKVSKSLSVQGGYSRRIYRPRLWDLNPFFNIRNNFNVRAGNPELLPEFTDSYEIGLISILNQVSLNVSLYHRYTTDKIERVSSFENNVNIFRPENIGTNKATGIETNFKYTPYKILTLNGDLNYNIFNREGSFEEQDFDFSADQWTAKLTTKLKITKTLESEVTLRHESREQTIQGSLAANSYADLGLRYKILKGKGIFSFSVRDVFASRIRQSLVEQSNFHITSKRQRGRFITLGFSYGFGKGEAMEYSGRRR